MHSVVLVNIISMKELICMGMKVIGFTGFDGGKLAQLADISIHIPTTNGEYALVEDAHSIICHFISVELRTLEFE